jgi:hypothetical protein
MKEEIRELLAQILENQQHILERLNRLEQRLFAESYGDRPVSAAAEFGEVHEKETEPAERIWRETLVKVKERISAESFDMWLKPARVHKLEGDILYVRAPDRFSAEWIASRYGKLLESSLPDGEIRHVRFGWLDEEDGGKFRSAESGETDDVIHRLLGEAEDVLESLRREPWAELEKFANPEEREEEK